MQDLTPTPYARPLRHSGDQNHASTTHTAVDTGR